MAHKIVDIKLRADCRPSNGYGPVVAEHIFDDGQVWPCNFEAHSSEDLFSRLQSVVEEREAERAALELGEG